MFPGLNFSIFSNLNLSNEYLTLRPYAGSDFAALAHQFNPDMFQWFFVKYNDCAEFVAEKMQKLAANEAVMYVIIDNSTGIIIGTTSIYEISYAHRRIETGSTWLGAAYRGKFYNTMAKYLLLEYMFETLKLHRVQWKTDRLNETSQLAMLKLGLIKEGVLRRHAVTYSGRVRDSVVFGLTDLDWPDTRLYIQRRIALKLAREVT